MQKFVIHSIKGVFRRVAYSNNRPFYISLSMEQMKAIAKEEALALINKKHTNPELLWELCKRLNRCTGYEQAVLRFLPTAIKGYPHGHKNRILAAKLFLDVDKRMGEAKQPTNVSKETKSKNWQDKHPGMNKHLRLVKPYRHLVLIK